MAEPSAYELWVLAGGGTKGYDPERYRDLMLEHGLLLRPGDEGYEDAPRNLPCGWPHRGEVEKGAGFMTDFIPQAGTEPRPGQDRSEEGTRP